MSKTTTKTELAACVQLEFPFPYPEQRTRPRKKPTRRRSLVYPTNPAASTADNEQESEN